MRSLTHIDTLGNKGGVKVHMEGIITQYYTRQYYTRQYYTRQYYTRQLYEGFKSLKHPVKAYKYQSLRLINNALYRSLAKKGPWALYLTLSPDNGVGGYL